MVDASIEVIELLICSTKDLNEPTYYYGWTPYTIAVYYKKAKAMAALANAGADTNGYKSLE